MKEEEGLYYPLSENKGADQLRGYSKAGLRLCFRICRLLVFSCDGSFTSKIILIRVLVLAFFTLKMNFYLFLQTYVAR